MPSTSTSQNSAKGPAGKTSLSPVLKSVDAPEVRLVMLGDAQDAADLETHLKKLAPTWNWKVTHELPKLSDEAVKFQQVLKRHANDDALLVPATPAVRNLEQLRKWWQEWRETPAAKHRAPTLIGMGPAGLDGYFAEFIDELREYWDLARRIAQAIGHPQARSLLPPRHDGVFVSYAGEDVKLALRIVDKLHAEKLKYFLAERNVSAGDDWLLGVSDALLDARAFLIVLTPTSATRDWVIFECGAAFGRGRRLLVYSDDETLKAPGPFRTRKPCTSKDVVKTVRKALEESPQPPPPTGTSP